MASSAQDQNTEMKRVQTFTQTGNFTRKLVLGFLIRQQKRGWRPGEVWTWYIRSTSDTGREEERTCEVSGGGVLASETAERTALFALRGPAAPNNELSLKRLIGLENRCLIEF